ncbi:MAG: hypothetical protein ACLFWF_10505 [Alphaproteobacteria bacterium]
MSSVPPKSPGEARDLRFWWVREEDRIRGPYTGKQMLAFLLKGFIRPGTPVRPDTEREWRLASDDPEFARYFAEPAAGAMPAAPPGTEERPARRLPHFVIIADGGACPAGRIEDMIGELGPKYRLTEDVWFLQSALPVEKIRTYLARQLSSIERLFIIDMRTGNWASHKFGEELEEGIRRLIDEGEADGL